MSYLDDMNALMQNDYFHVCTILTPEGQIYWSSNPNWQINGIEILKNFQQRPASLYVGGTKFSSMVNSPPENYVGRNLTGGGTVIIVRARNGYFFLTWTDANTQILPRNIHAEVARMAGKFCKEEGIDHLRHEMKELTKELNSEFQISKDEFQISKDEGMKVKTTDHETVNREKTRPIGLIEISKYSLIGFAILGLYLGCFFGAGMGAIIDNIFTENANLYAITGYDSEGLDNSGFYSFLVLIFLLLLPTINTLLLFLCLHPLKVLKELIVDKRALTGEDLFMIFIGGILGVIEWFLFAFLGMLTIDMPFSFSDSISKYDLQTYNFYSEVVGSAVYSTPIIISCMVFCIVLFPVILPVTYYFITRKVKLSQKLTNLELIISNTTKRLSLGETVSKTTIIELLEEYRVIIDNNIQLTDTTEKLINWAQYYEIFEVKSSTLPKKLIYAHESCWLEIVMKDTSEREILLGKVKFDIPPSFNLSEPITKLPPILRPQEEFKFLKEFTTYTEGTFNLPFTIEINSDYLLRFKIRIKAEEPHDVLALSLPKQFMEKKDTKIGITFVNPYRKLNILVTKVELRILNKQSSDSTWEVFTVSSQQQDVPPESTVEFSATKIRFSNMGQYLIQGIAYIKLREDKEITFKTPEAEIKVYSIPPFLTYDLYLPERIPKETLVSGLLVVRNTGFGNAYNAHLSIASSAGIKFSGLSEHRIAILSPNETQELPIELLGIKDGKQFVSIKGKYEAKDGEAFQTQAKVNTIVVAERISSEIVLTNPISIDLVGTKIVEREPLCLWCGNRLAESYKQIEEKCSNCRKDIRCMVCRQPMVKGEEIMECINGHSAHKTHFLEWVKIRGSCPVCKVKIRI